jgi:DNA-binding protein HU-beta
MRPGGQDTNRGVLQPVVAAGTKEMKGSAGMKKQELVKAIAADSGVSESTVNSVVSSMFTTIEKALADGDEVAISGFGTFRVVERPGRDGRNPQTGETIKIGPKKAPQFKAGAGLKRAVE